jgi:lysophospholipase L1-like esterase
LALALGALGGLALIEGALWVLALVRPPTSRAGELALQPGERRIVCFGDSNTYGIHLTAEDSYPGRLQRLLDRAPGHPWRVVNLGFPGRNTAQVRKHFARDVEAYGAEAAVVWAGVNNSWSLAESQLWQLPDREEDASTAMLLLSRLRTVKLARILLERATGAGRKAGAPAEAVRPLPGDGDLRQAGGGVELDPELTSSARPVADVQASIGVDLRRIRALCDAGGVRLLFANYPLDIQLVADTVNPAIERAAAETGTPLVDLHAALTPRFESLGYRTLMLEDLHANELGNYEVARQVLLGLMDAGIVEERPEWRSIPPVESVAVPVRVQREDLAGRELTLAIEGPAGWRIELQIAPLLRGADGRTSAGAPQDPRAFGLDPLAARGYFPPALDDSGRLAHRVQLPAPQGEPGHPLRARSAWRLWAAVRAKDGDAPALSPPLDVDWSELELSR